MKIEGLLLFILVIVTIGIMFFSLSSNLKNINDSIYSNKQELKTTQQELSTLRLRSDRLVTLLEINSDNKIDFKTDSNAAGLYFPSSESILLFTNKNNINTNMGRAEHELGHYFWYEFLDTNSKNEYELIFDKNVEFVTEYAKTNVREDFAETFKIGWECSFNLELLPENRREFFEIYVINSLQ